MAAKQQTETRTLQLSLELSDDLIKVRWTTSDNSTDWDPYEISLAELRERAADLRTALKNFEKSLDHGPTSPELHYARDQLILQGQKTYKFLFTGAERDRFSGEIAAEIKTWLETEVAAHAPTPWRIQVVHSGYNFPLVPWGLVYPGSAARPATDEDGEDLDAYYPFWAVNFNLACRSHMSNNVDFQRSGDLIEAPTEILTCANLSAAELKSLAKTLHPKSPTEIHEYVISSPREFLDLPEERPGTNYFVYLNLKAGETGLNFSRDQLTVEEIEKIRHKAERHFVLFIDGGAVLRNDNAPDWIDAIFDVGRSGMIGAEVDITHPDRRYFGWEIFKSFLLEPKPLLDALDDARRKLLPESLLYGIYCDPLRIYFNPTLSDLVERVDRAVVELRKRNGSSGTGDN